MQRLLNVIAGPNKGQVYLVSDTFTTLLGRSRQANNAHYGRHQRVAFPLPRSRSAAARSADGSR